MAAASATGVIAVRLSGNARSTMGAAASRAGRGAPSRVARRASGRVVAAAGADRSVAGKVRPKRFSVVDADATPLGFASAGLARVGSSRGASFAAAASSGETPGDADDDAPVRLTAEEREALDAEAEAMASSWASELSAAAWDDAEAAGSAAASADALGASGKKKRRDTSLRAAVANETGDDDDDDDDFEENYYDYDADDVEEGYEPGSGSATRDDADATPMDPLTKAKRRRKTRREWGMLPDEKLPRVAIVGRPNVGKSALFNRLTGTKRAIVYDQPGITRDRMYVRAFWGDVEFMMVDTGGLESLPGSPQDAPSVDTVGGVEILPGMVESQAALAVREAAALVFVVDGQKGLTSADEEIFGWIRKFHSATPLMLAVNKCESTTKGEEQILDFWSLGGVEPLAVSAISGTGTGELMDALVKSLPAPDLDDAGDGGGGAFSEDDDAPLKVAIVGRPNVGKSSLLNQLAGDARAIVSDYSGTTRDTIDSDVTGADGNKYTLIDTAGIRRRTAVAAGKDVPESLAVGRALQAMRRADIVVLVVDAEEGPSQQDFVLAERAATQEGCGLVLCVNKWDLIDKDSYSMNEYTKTLRSKLRVFEWASVVYTSALTGQRIQKVLQAANEASTHHRKRLSTATLNAVVQEASLWKSPPSKGGRKGKIYYVTQASTRPPTFVFFVNEPKLFAETYRRYMERSLRENIGFPGSPVRILWRGKGVGKKP